MSVVGDNDLEIPGAEPEDDGHVPTVLELFGELKEERERQAQLMSEAEERERMVLGLQWRGRDPLFEEVVPSESIDDRLITKNLLYPLCLTWNARVDQGRIDPRAFPFNPEAGDVEDAEAANSILDYEKQRCSERKLIARAGMRAQMHGDVLFYPQWSEADGPHRVRRQKLDQLGPMFDMATNQPVYEEVWEYGGIVEDVISATDYWTSGEEHYRDAEQLVVRRIISKHKAKQRLMEARAPSPGVDDMGNEVPGDQRYPSPNPTVEDYPTAVESSRRGVECFEVWSKPGTIAPDGMYALIVDERVVMAIPYPKHPKTEKLIYDGTLPGDVWKIGEIPGCPRGKTHVADACPQQRLVNTALSSILARAEIARSAYLVGPSQVIEEMKNARANRVKNDDDKDIRATTMWFEGPGVPSTLMDVEQMGEAGTYACFGVSEATVSGGDPTETKSGQQLRDATALDGQKIYDPRDGLEQARLKVAKDKLTLWQVHADEQRFVRVLGPGGAVQARWLRSADVMGADIALEIGSGLQSSHLAGQHEAEQLGAAGSISPGAATERRETGLAVTVGEADAQARIDAQANKAAKGEPQQPLPEVDPSKALERLRGVIASLVMAGQDPRGVVQLAQAYEQAAALKAKATQAGQGQANGPGKIQQPSPKPAAAITDAKKIPESP